ncbi:MAG: response regulator transcription factor [Phycisphaerales bacterium]|nr:MAG: helix-turn-helix transcriptional regulator [Phycisphaerales bacterium]
MPVSHNQGMFTVETKTLLGKLSEAQRRVLVHLLEGLSEPEIADRIHRSRHTVHDHTKAIYAALGVSKRVQLVHLFAGIEPKAVAPSLS